MAFDPMSLPHVAAEHLGNKPHPDVPDLKVNQYDAFARTAARMFGTRKPEPEQVQTAYHALVNAGIAPAEFERLWDVGRPLANSLLDRDPTLHDIMQLVGQPPPAVATYYHDHPHPEVPDVSAGKVAMYQAHASPIAQTLHGREPNHVELRRFASGNYTTEDMVAHYMDDGTSLKQGQGGA
jgi:hypothetical protein